METPYLSAPVALEALAARLGQEIGVSRWFPMDQDRINAFADATEDWYFIHTDPEKAAASTPWGGTIAHGFLTASLLSAMAYEVIPPLEGVTHGVNYGFDKLRFVSPVPTGSRVRGRFALERADQAKPGEITLIFTVTVEIEGQEVAAGGRPALVAQWVLRQFLAL
ncbi:MAG: MaoC family dehydratase [Pseudomonadota bacterium]